MEGEMTEIIRPVRFGIIIGLLGLVFGIGWAFYLALGEERIGKDLEAMMKQDVGRKEEILKVSLDRLGMGHSHSMALGLLTIATSLILALTSAPDKVKTVGSTLTGVGGILFPIAWIIMGYRTPLLGMEGAHESIIPLAGIGVVCILSGSFIAVGSLVRDALK
jgi:hypothetical protein